MERFLGLGLMGVVLNCCLTSCDTEYENRFPRLEHHNDESKECKPVVLSSEEDKMIFILFPCIWHSISNIMSLSG